MSESVGDGIRYVNASDLQCATNFFLRFQDKICLNVDRNSTDPNGLCNNTDNNAFVCAKNRDVWQKRTSKWAFNQ